MVCTTQVLVLSVWMSLFRDSELWLHFPVAEFYSFNHAFVMYLDLCLMNMKICQAHAEKNGLLHILLTPIS